MRAKIKKWLKDKLGITTLERKNHILREHLAQLEKYVDHQLKEMNELTRVDADVGMRGNNTIILTGVYRKKAFVRFYDIGDGEFERMVHQLKDMRRHHLIRHIDEPYPCANIRGTYEI